MRGATRWGLWVAGLLAVGCTQRLIDEGGAFTDTAGDETPPVDDGPPDDEEPLDDDDIPPPDDDDDPMIGCVDQVIPANELPVSLEGPLAQGTSRYQPSCIGSVSAEVTFSFTAPRTTTYLFDTEGSSFDTVLYALGPECEPPERACNDDSNGTVASQIGLGMRAGETVVIVVDGFGEAGEWSLQAREGGTCPNQTLEPLPELYFAGFLDDSQENSVVPSCAGSGPDIVFAWTPPFSGRWRMSTSGSDFDTVLAVYTGDCLTELACNDDAPNDASSVLDIDLEEGVPIAIAIDSYTGEAGGFQLSILPN